MAAYVVLLGAPGAGKGTQAQAICKDHSLTHISTGDLFRENIAKKTPSGIVAKNFIDQGQLVPDSVTIAMVEDRLSQEDCCNGALLDGFPRTLVQAKALDEMLNKRFNSKVDAVPYIEVTFDALKERICGRRMCKNGHVFHIKYHPENISGVCDVCGEPLFQRADDSEETLAKRMNVYLEQTAPLIQYYSRQGVLVKINGDQDITKVTEDIQSQLADLLIAKKD